MSNRRDRDALRSGVRSAGGAGRAARAALSAAVGALLLLTTSGCFWLQAVSNPTEVHYARVPGPVNWKLALHRFKPSTVAKEKEPLILAHGYAGNYIYFDLDRQRSMARYLQDRGYDVWALDFRGCGDSTGTLPLTSRSPYDVNFDSFVNGDAPAAINFVKAITKRDRVSWIGHSLGGMVGLAYLATNTQAHGIKNLVAMGARANFERLNNAIEILLRFRKLVAYYPTLYLKYPSKMMANNAGFTDTRFEALLWNTEVINPRTISMALYNAVSDIPHGLYAQIVDWLESGKFRSADRTIDYENELKNIRSPTLIVAGRLDGLAPPYEARNIFRKISSTDKEMRIFGKANGYSGDYGHLGLLLGDNASTEVYPYIYDWLQRH